MALYSLDDIAAGKTALEGKLGNIQRINGEYIAVRNRVVPWGARPVVAEVIAVHVAVRREPCGEIVDALACAIQRQRPRLASGRNAVRIGRHGDLAYAGRAVDERSMVEVHLGQGNGYLAVCLID